MTALDFVFVLLFTLFAALGSYFFKISDRIRGIIKNWHIYLGVLSYLLSNIFFILALKNNNLTIVFAFTGLNYIWSLILGGALLKEKITRTKIIAVGLIVVGVIVINF